METTPYAAVPPLRRPSFLLQFLPCILAFAASFCVMVIELVAGRVIAKHVGSSLYTWTSVIGVVLGGITLGNLVGGRLADWFQPRRTLSVLFLLAAVACMAIPLLDHRFGDSGAWSLENIDSWPRRIVFHVAGVFFFPALALGLIGPVVAKMALDQGRATGRTVGNVYSWGALGSIVGTFLTGFCLIPAMGTVAIIFSVAGSLGAVGLALAPSFIWPLFLAGCGLFLLEAYSGPWEWKVGNYRFAVAKRQDSNSIYNAETAYQAVKITETSEDGSRELILDNLIHAYYVPADEHRLEYDYEKIYAGVTRRAAARLETPSALFFGGGGYIFPRYIQSTWPGSRIQVAEIDPGVTAADIEGFGLTEDQIQVVGGAALASAEASDSPDENGGEDETSEPAGGGNPVRSGSGEANDSGEATHGDATESPPAIRPIEVYHLDARNRVHELVRLKRTDPAFEPFDFIYGDAFNYYAVPYHLVTREFCEKVKDLLRPATGIYMINVIDIFDSGQFLGSVCNTMEVVFPHVYVFSNTNGGPNLKVAGRDTFIVIGALAPIDLAELGQREGEEKFEGSLLTEEHLAQLREKSHGVVLTDDYAPVEYLLKEVVRRK